MNLRRYNEILFAVVVTAAAVVLVVHLLRFGLHHHHGEGAGVTGAPSPPSRSVAAPGAERSMALCLPSSAPGSDWQYFPVVAVGAVPAAAAASTPWTTDVSQACHLAEGSFQGVFDMVIRNTSTNEQRLLLVHPGQILDMTLPDAGCGSAVGPVPCNTIFWLLRERDSHDETVLYASDLAARSLSRLSPQDSSVLDWVWIARSGEVLLQVQLATGGTKVVNARLQPTAPGSEVVVPRVLDQLQRTLHPESAPAQENQGQPLFVPATPSNPAAASTSSGGS